MSEQPSKLKPLLLGRYWVMPDGEIMPNIAGANGEGDENAPSESEVLQSQLKEARSEAAKNRKELKALKDKLEGIDIEQFDELKKGAEDAKRIAEEEKGNYSKIIEDMKRSHDASLLKANDSSASWKKRFEEKAIDNELSSAASKAIKPSAAVTLVRSEYDFNVSEDGSIEIQKGGETIFDDTGKPLTPSLLMARHLEDNPYLVSANSNQGSGSQQPTRGKAMADNTTEENYRDGLSELLANKS